MSAAEKFLQMGLEALARAGSAVVSAPREQRSDQNARTAAVPAVALPAPAVVPAPRVLASYLDHQVVAAGRPLSRGAAQLWQLVYHLAVYVGKQRGYQVAPDQITYHCPAVTLAGVLGVTDRHVRRLARELEAVGLLDCGGHAQQVLGRSMYDGTLWAVTMVPDAAPRIRPDEWKHSWRPDFVADVEGKTGALAEMSGLLTEGADEAEKMGAAKRRAANPADLNPLPLSSSDILPLGSLRAVSEGLSELWHLHASKRARAVGLLASKMAQLLAEPERRRYWCRVIWDALKGENEQRGSLQTLGAQIERLEVDLREGAPWKNPGAVLAARLKAA